MTDIIHQIRSPKLSVIVAMTADRVIGLNGRLPWHLPEDLRLFRRLTLGNTIIMGRHTYKSIGRPLPGRQCIVLSRTTDRIPGVVVCQSFAEALDKGKEFSRPIFAIGGRQIYCEALPRACVLHVSWVTEPCDGDVYFPEMDPAAWIPYQEEKYRDFRYVRYRHRECG